MLSSTSIFSIAFAASTNAQPASKEAVQEILIKMGYEDIFISKCWINSARTIEPKEENGWTKRYPRFINLDYLKAFSDQEIQQVGQGQNAFYRFENRLDANYLLRPPHLIRFEAWV